MRIALALVLFAAFAPPLEAQTLIAQNGMRATQTGPTEILVSPRSRANATDYWCAAGDYAVRVMGLSQKTRIWRATPASARVAQGVLFTLDPAKKAEGAGLSEYGSGPRDGSMSLGMAVGNFCRPILPFWRD